MNMKGFTLIETMVAITILAFAVSGPLFTANRAIIAAQTARDQLVALYLAQEGVEYVRMLRDNEYLNAYREGGEDVSKDAWDNFLHNQSLGKCREDEYISKICTLDSVLDDSALKSCSSDTCDPLYLAGNGAASNIYTQESSGNVRSPFTRTVQSVKISNNEEKIVSTVSWTFHGTPYTVTVSNHLTPWQ